MTESIILFHGGCPDGFSGAWLLDRWLRSEDITPELWPCKYGIPPPDVTDKFVYMVDFCYDDLDWMKTVIGQSAGFLLLDHHRTGEPLLDNDTIYDIIDDAKLFGRYDNIDDLFYEKVCDSFDNKARSEILCTDEKRLVIDQSHSGAMLAALYTGFITNPVWTDNACGEPYEFVYYVEDTDIWRKSLPYTDEAYCAICSYPYTIDDWDRIEEMGVNSLISEGTPIYRYKQELIAYAVSNAQPIVIDGIRMLGTAAPVHIGSEVGHELALKMPSKVGAYWSDHISSRKIGLRSLPDGPDVSLICKKWGGNGHRHAAGFSIPYTIDIPEPKEEVI